MDTKSDPEILQLYPLYIDNWIRRYPDFVDNEKNLQKFAKSNVEVITRYRDYLKAYIDH